MHKNNTRFQRQSFPAFRKLSVDATEMAKKKHTIHGLIEVDITQTRQDIKACRRKTGKAVSLTSFILACIGKAVDENRIMHGYLNWRNQLILFEDVDLLLPVEMRIGAHDFPVVHILRSINKRTPSDIENEIRLVKERGISDPDKQKQWKNMQLFLRLPGFIRRICYRVIMRCPGTFKKFMGTVAVTAVGMFGSGGGWGMGLSNHTLDITIGGITKRPVVKGKKLENRDFLALTIDVDHDIIDGAPAARFVKRLRYFIENGIGLNRSSIHS